MIVSTDPGLVVRTARKPWRCICADPVRRSGSPNPNFRPECEGDIPVGTVHVEYLGEVAGYESGYRYCATCAVAVWPEVTVAG